MLFCFEKGDGGESSLFKSLISEYGKGVADCGFLNRLNAIMWVCAYSLKTKCAKVVMCLLCRIELLGVNVSTGKWKGGKQPLRQKNEDGWGGKGFELDWID